MATPATPPKPRPIRVKVNGNQVDPATVDLQVEETVVYECNNGKLTIEFALGRTPFDTTSVISGSPYTVKHGGVFQGNCSLNGQPLTWGIIHDVEPH
jgi:hypothetical protein